jgi:6-phosphofructokinase 1
MKLGVLTSGGDAPGMNAAIRAAVRCGTDRGFSMAGVRRGYRGLIEGDIIPLDNRAVGGIIERGGTLLRTSRSSSFLTPEGQRRALHSICEHELNGLIVIGGNGSLRGVRWLGGQGVATVGIPSSIDNDIPKTEMAIGVDSALNTVVDSLNRIRDTAISHERAFVIEVMGRKSGYIALMGGLAGGGEIVLLPERPIPLTEIATRVREGVEKGKKHAIIVIAEGFVPSDCPLDGRSPGQAVAAYLEEAGIVETRLTILGHLQRGGSPTAFDRILACRFAEAAVRWLAEGQSNVFTALVGGEIAPVPLSVIDEPCTNVSDALRRLVDIVAH